MPQLAREMRAFAARAEERGVDVAAVARARAALGDVAPGALKSKSVAAAAVCAWARAACDPAELFAPEIFKVGALLARRG